MSSRPAEKFRLVMGGARLLRNSRPMQVLISPCGRELTREPQSPLQVREIRTCPECRALCGREQKLGEETGKIHHICKNFRRGRTGELSPPRKMDGMGVDRPYGAKKQQSKKDVSSSAVMT